jgi:carboxypeptidase family protein
MAEMNPHATLRPLVVLLLSCAAATPMDAQAVPGGTITGKATFDGTPPKPQAIPMAADPICAKQGKTTPSETIVVGAGNALQNVFVYVKDGLGDRSFPAPTSPVVLDQKGCRYTPHVFGIQLGQPLEIVNSDPTLHNVHALAKTNPEFNLGQPSQGMRARRTFKQVEVMMPIRCDVHGWMSSYAGVLNHPFFAVSSADGSFTIKGLPAGSYTIEAWHERLGTQTQKVTIDEKQGATAAFKFSM